MALTPEIEMQSKIERDGEKLERPMPSRELQWADDDDDA
jgi:hypothetical protein